jgi:transmembrane sensor
MTASMVEELAEKFVAGTASDEEIKQLMEWYQMAVPGEVIWPSEHGEAVAVQQRMLQRLQKETHRGKLRSLYGQWLKIAAMLIIVAGTVFWLTRQGKNDSEEIRISNGPGKIQRVDLPDGSTVWLNAGATLRYQTAFKKQRQIFLEGEAFFDVKPDPSHPFTVHAAGIQARVLGTSFNISADPSASHTVVSLLSGRLEVSGASGLLSQLTPSQQLTFDRATRKASVLSVDTSLMVAWKKGMLRFSGEFLGDIAGKLENWYGISIRFEDSTARACRYYMSFSQDLPLDRLLPLLAEITGMRYRFDKNTNTLLLTGKACGADQKK